MVHDNLIKRYRYRKGHIMNPQNTVSPRAFKIKEPELIYRVVGSRGMHPIINTLASLRLRFSGVTDPGHNR